MTDTRTVNLSECPDCRERVVVFLRDADSSSPVLDVLCAHCHDPGESLFRADVRFADTEQLSGLALPVYRARTTCDSCGAPVQEWPGNDCDGPQEHTDATYDCVCGETVTIEQAIADPSRHRRCHLIGVER